MRCSPDDKLSTIKSHLYDMEGFPTDLQRLLYAGKQLEDDRTLSDYNIQQVTLLAPYILSGLLRDVFTDNSSYHTDYTLSREPLCMFWTECQGGVPQASHLSSESPPVG